MSALIIAELEARASAVDSVLTLARVRMERQGAMVRVGFYLCQGRYHFMKLVSALEAYSDQDLGTVARFLGDVQSLVQAHLRRLSQPPGR